MSNIRFFASKAKDLLLFVFLAVNGFTFTVPPSVDKFLNEQQILGFIQEANKACRLGEKVNMQISLGRLFIHIPLHFLLMSEPKKVLFFIQELIGSAVYRVIIILNGLFAIES